MLWDTDMIVSHYTAAVLLDLFIHFFKLVCDCWKWMVLVVLLSKVTHGDHSSPPVSNFQMTCLRIMHANQSVVQNNNHTRGVLHVTLESEFCVDLQSSYLQAYSGTCALHSLTSMPCMVIGQNDITDSVLWAINEGYADRDRVAITGISFGGYCTLAGITFTPGKIFNILECI